jgi:hypothetical protein
MNGSRRGLLAAGFGALAVAMVVLGAAQAQTPTTSPSPTLTASPAPSASPSPTPFAGPTSTITIRFVRGGQPVTIGLGSPISSIFADGVLCKLPLFPAVAIESSGYSTVWPLGPEPSRTPPDQPIECAKGPPTIVRFEFSSQFGLLVTELVWLGANVTVDIEVPPLAATPSPSPPAVGLPRTGGRP